MEFPNELAPLKIPRVPHSAPPGRYVELVEFYADVAGDCIPLDPSPEDAPIVDAAEKCRRRVCRVRRLARVARDASRRGDDREARFAGYDARHCAASAFGDMRDAIEASGGSINYY